MANTTEALQEVLTKVKTLTAYRYEEEDALLNENRLQRYAKFQYLTGIFVLDENFSVLAHYDKAGKDESLLLMKRRSATPETEKRFPREDAAEFRKKARERV